MATKGLVRTGRTGLRAVASRWPGPPRAPSPLAPEVDAVPDGPPRMPILPDYYEILQVHPKAGEAVVKKAYRTLLLDCRQHPDQGGDAHRAALLTEAYEVLADPQRRAEYDRWYFHRAAQAPPRGPEDLPLIVLCPSCVAKNRVRSQAVLAIARCSRCGHSLSRVPRAAAGGARGRFSLPRRTIALGAVGLAVSVGAAWWALMAGPLWGDPVELAARHLAADRLATAREVLGSALRFDPDNPRLHEKLGETFLLERRYNEASNHFQLAGRLSPENAHLLAREGRARQLLGQLDDSERAYRAALRVDPAYVPALVDLGHVLARRKRYAEAVQFFEAAMRLEPSSDLAYNLGMACKLAGRSEPAVLAFKEAVRLDPAHRPSLVQLAELYHRRGALLEAATHYALASRLRHHDLELHLRLAALYERIGQRALAVTEWRVCLEQGRGDPAVLSRARRALEKLGEPG